MTLTTRVVASVNADMTNSTLLNSTKSWIQRITGKFSAGIGLLLILCGILYLLAGFLAALDAISFQDRVLRIVGDDNRMQARSILNKLDQIRRIEPSDRPKDAEGLPIETLALQLDRVKATTATLGSFENAIQLPDQPASRAVKTEEQSRIVMNWLIATGMNSQPENIQNEIVRLLQELDLVDEHQLARIDVDDLMKDLGNDLRNELRLLNNQIDDSVSGIKMVRSLNNIQDLLKQTDSTRDLLSASSVQSAGSAQNPLSINLAADQFKEQLVQLEEYLRQLNNVMPREGAEGEFSKQYFDFAMEGLNKIRALTSGSAKRIQSNLDQIFVILGTIETKLVSIYDLMVEPKPAALNELFMNLQGDAEKINAVVPIDNSANMELGDPLKEFEKKTSELAEHIRTTLPEIETIQKITPDLAQMEIASNALLKLIVDSNRINIVIDGQTVTGFEAANLYKKQVESLSTSVSSMTESLKELSDEGLLAQLLADDPEALAKAGTLLRDHEKISRAEFPLSVWGWKVIDPSTLAVASREKLDIMMVLIVGAIGSMIYMTQRMLKLIMHRQTGDRSQRMPFLWYFARPVFGAVVAFAVYLVYQTGQVAFGTGGLAEALENGINIPILTVIGLLAGLLSWQALDMIQSKGEVWLKSGTREPLWATGLARVLEAKDQTEESCSRHLGVTIGQIDRWIRFKDKVLPEMQDRLSTWLGVHSEDLFSATSLAGKQNQMPMYANGLKPFLQRIDAQQSIKSISLALGVKDEIVERWRDQKQPVSSEYQWQLVNLINERYAQFFSTKVQNDKNWALRLRDSMSESPYPNSTALASKLHIDEEWVKKWRDLYEPVPETTARLIAETVQDDFHVLFDPDFDRLSDQFFAVIPALEQAIVAKYDSETALDWSDKLANAVSDFAKEMDVSENWVDDWLNGRKPLFAPTRKAVALVLGQEESALFKNYTAESIPPRPSQLMNEGEAA